MAEEKVHNWTNEETQALIEWRAANEFLFTRKRNASKSGWEVCVAKLGFNISPKQAGKKWNNLKEKYKDLRDPPTGKGVESGTATAATWQWYSLMDAALQGQHSISPPLTVAANLTPTSGGTVTNQASDPGHSSAGKVEGKKRTRSTEAVLEFLKEQAERDEEKHKEAVAREEERERAATARAEKYLALFEKLINKF